MPLLKLIKRLWMAWAHLVSLVVTKLMVAILFVVIMTPIAIVFRLLGRDALRRGKSYKSQDTFWRDHPQMDDPASYDRLF